MIPAHGGRLIDRIVTGTERERLVAAAADMPSLTLNEREYADVEMIGTGALSPLEGFMGQDDYRSVVDRMRLAQGLPWTLPVTLAVKEGEGEQYSEGQDVALMSPSGQLTAVLHLEDKYRVDKEYEAEATLSTKEVAHPGVQYLQTVGSIYLGGRLSVVNPPEHAKFTKYRLDPKDTRVLFKTKGWQTVVAFQTRNPIHRAHEYLTKCALEITDGLLIHPLVGETKSDDIPADVRMQCYELLMEKYYPRDRVALSVYPQAMRYAGPREAIFHAILRKNYGCTHFIVGRDHAGVGSYYGTYDAQHLFDHFEDGELGIVPLKFEHSFWCKLTGGMATSKTSSSAPSDRIFLSGTKVREMLNKGEMPPQEFTRPEIAQVLIEAARAKA